MITRTLIINDVHIPFHDSRALALVLDIFEDIGCDRLIINGDLLDFYGVNMHGPKSPLIENSLEDELIAGREFISQLRHRFKKQHIVYLFGNHESRLNRFILQHCKAFWNILTVEKYLYLDDNNIEWHPYNHKYRLEKTNCYIQHSPPSYGVNGARTSLLKKLDQTYIYGCTHREQKAFVTAGSGQVHGAYFNGWLGSVNETKEHQEVFSYIKGHSDWQQCFSIVTVENEKDFHINQYSIRNHKVVVDGSLYQG